MTTLASSRGTVHRFRNSGTETARLVLTFTPSGIEHPRRFLPAH